MVSATIRTAQGVGTLIGRVWFPALAVVAAVWLIILGLVAWRFAGERVNDVRGLFDQVDMLVGVSQAGLAFMVALAAIQQARIASRTARLMHVRDEQERMRERLGVVHAYVGSAIEVTAYAGAMAEVQRRGLRTWRRLVFASRTAEQIRLTAWRLITDAVAASAKGLELVRYSEPDLEGPAEELFGVVLTIHDLAMEGRSDMIQAEAERIRDMASELRARATMTTPALV